MDASHQSTEEVIQEIMRIHRSLPRRPSLDEVEAAEALIRNVDREEQLRIGSVMKQRKGTDVPDQLFSMLQEMQKHVVLLQSQEHKRDALQLLDLERIHVLFDEFIQKASMCVSGVDASAYLDHSNGYNIPDAVNSSNSTAASCSVSMFESPLTVPSSFRTQGMTVTSTELITRDDSYLHKGKAPILVDGIDGGSGSLLRAHFSEPSITLATNLGENGEKLSLIKLASLIEVSARNGVQELALHDQLMDQIKWLPDSIGKLSKLINLDLSGNQVHALPQTIGGLSSLTKLNLQSNQIAELPVSIGDLFSLADLDLRCNRLTSLPPSFGKLSHLVELNLSSNQLFSLPDSIGNLTILEKLNIETNDIEELPHTIGNCSSLVELRADYNCLKALPEAVGRLQRLKILAVRYNSIKSLPTTIASMASLKELDVSFNALESISESLCLVTTLVKMNVGNNFADLQHLPQSIGNLEKLEELDISNNQIHVLPKSFGMLSNLRVLHAEENPLEVPPRHIAEMGAQAVVRYMTELTAQKDIKVQSAKPKWTWSKICFFSWPNKRKHGGVDYVKA